jgi:hypothetical protein
MAAQKTPAAVLPDGRALPLARALDNSAPLASLLRRLKQSRDCFDTIGHLMAPDLLARTRPGPLGDTDWCVLADNGAVAAKLRQLLPSFEAALRAQGRTAVSIKIKVQARSTDPPPR